MEKWKSLDRCNVLDETEKDDNCRIYKDELIDNLSDSIDLSKFCDKLVQRYNVDLSHLPWETQYSYLRGKSLYVLPESQLKQQLVDSKVKWKPLVVKFWIDPTWSDIHLWHTVPIIMLNRLQRMWHNISFVIWDFTAGIWDPTWRSKERPTMTDDQINENLATYKSQISPFLDVSKLKVFHNSEWHNKTTLKDLIKTLSMVNLSSVLQRDDFRSRLENNQGLSLSELIYPIMMWMDSVTLKKDEWCDIELWWKDQFLNMQMCRMLMEKFWEDPETIISTDILEWISWDWKKMSKSLNNYIALNDSPKDIYGKIMSIPDRLLEIYYKSLTEITNEEWNFLSDNISSWKINPIYLKKSLARIIITVIYDKDSANKAEDEFNGIFGKDKKYWDLDLPTKSVLGHSKLIETIAQQFNMSNSEIRRLADAWAISLIFKDNSVKKMDGSWIMEELSLINESEFIIKVWKKKLFRAQIDNH